MLFKLIILLAIEYKHVDNLLYCTLCDHLLGIEHRDLDQDDHFVSFVCSNSECEKYGGGYLVVNHKVRIRLTEKLRSLGAKERKIDPRTFDVLEGNF